MCISKKIVITLITVSIVIVSGCYKLVGGGWIDGLFGGKAHFAFQAQCEEFVDGDGWYNAGFYTGQFQFMDKSADVRFHGEIEIYNAVFSPDPITCEEVGTAVVGQIGNHSEFYGECWTQPGKVPGTFAITVDDVEGEQGWGRGDMITIETDCTSDGSVYLHAGAVGGGNISFPMKKEKVKGEGKSKGKG